MPASPEALKQREQELETLRAEQKKALENEAKLKREIESIGDDRRKFNQQTHRHGLTRARVEERIARDPGAPQPLDEQRAGRCAQSLEERREVIAEVLAALQRIGRHPPPA